MSQIGPSDSDELARLEAQREHFLALVADQAKVHKRHRLLVQGLMAGLVVFGCISPYSGQMEGPTVMLTSAILVTLVFVLRRQVPLFGSLIFVEGPDARDLLAECDTSISRLKESRS